jgi:hypothetical protein
LQVLFVFREKTSPYNEAITLFSKEELMFKKSEISKICRRALVLVDELDECKTAEDRQKVYSKAVELFEELYTKLGSFERRIIFSKVRSALKKFS